MGSSIGILGVGQWITIPVAESEGEAESRPLKDILDEIMEKKEQNEDIIADSIGEEKISEDGESDTGD